MKSPSRSTPPLTLTWYDGGILPPRPDAHHPTWLQTQCARQLQGVVVAVPNEDSPLGQEHRQPGGRKPVVGQGHGGHAAGEARGVGDALNGDAG